ncbi:DeoR/GlpR family DNA-binding transcription regulator [Actinomyces ruminis]|uniref:Lactose phosphotransferase system repressor n=1 Tax=Actinomyces ruminis TaxID=1937003 RepID=A0ABX4MCE2_9ACTO|nr:DeoR/GlpR family DNA-binding transcription regulator [Actinomyces ruminis]PHP53159.1 DeoR/GlpR transcriptional regulator [Actinomyces ruminis]
MNAEQRQQDIVDAVSREGRVAVTDLAARYGVTVETIRRDLTALDRTGAVRKVHGGAVPATVLALPETAVAERELLGATAKQAIAAAAIGALDLRPGATILLDAGTTVGCLARLLPEGLGLTVVTNSVLTAALLAGRGDLTVRILGGQVRGITQAAVGPEALEALAALRVNVAVMGTNGLTAEHGLSTPDPDEAAVKRAMVRAARRVVALADATKIGQEHLVSFADLDDVDLLVTDAALPSPLAAQLADTGTEVLIA